MRFFPPAFYSTVRLHYATEALAGFRKAREQEPGPVLIDVKLRRHRLPLIAVAAVAASVSSVIGRRIRCLSAAQKGCRGVGARAALPLTEGGRLIVTLCFQPTLPRSFDLCVWKRGCGRWVWLGHISFNDLISFDNRLTRRVIF